VYSSKIDVAVLCVFFIRPDTFEKVFEQVKKARPSKLFLYQDGPRAGREEDRKNIAACRKIAEEGIDWDCQVYRNYQEENVGCDPSMYNAITWMFSHVDKGIILEDDIVASQSFFPFCKELLDRYENDNRVFTIAGMNHLDIYGPEDADYFFSRRSAIWGWATWKRCIDMFDTEYSFLKNPYTIKTMRPQIEALDEKIKMCQWHQSTGIRFFETIIWNTKSTQNMLDIVPTKNLTSNIGVGAGGTHGAGSMDVVPNGLKQVYYKKTYEYEFPLRHPKHMVPDVYYNKRFCRILSEGHPMVKAWRSVEGGFKSFRYAGKEERKEKLKRLPKTIINVLHIAKG
jgi:hypothetical protein